MRCGETCFIVTYELRGEQQASSILARTPTEARKKLRVNVGAEANILSVKRDK